MIGCTQGQSEFKSMTKQEFISAMQNKGFYNFEKYPLCFTKMHLNSMGQAAITTVDEKEEYTDQDVESAIQSYNELIESSNAGIKTVA